jgi:DNA-binding response OmpR family regulator
MYLHSNGTEPQEPRRKVLLVGHPEGAGLADGLQDMGLDVAVASLAEAEAGTARVTTDTVLICLDSVAGEAAGAALLDRLVQEGRCGVLVMLGEDSEAARVEVLDRGADDVLSETVPLRELAARLCAVGRRVARHAVESEAGAAILLDVSHRCLIGPDGTHTPLSEAEFVALETLLDADGAPVAREWLGRVALKRPLHPDDRSVDQLVLKLRRKLSATGAAERTILSARRQGYVIADPSRFRANIAARRAAPAMSESGVVVAEGR